jgi:membrane-associated protein
VEHFVQDVLGGVPTWVVYLAVFALPFLEASIFLGFVFPGETALVFGGVLASQGEVDLSTVIALAVVGAIAGDAVGYAIGRRWGRGLQRTRLGQRVGNERWATTERFLIRRGAPAVFFGRWTALLRAMVPSAAGMAHLPYRTFALWNALGGTFWAITCVVGGYLAGDVIGRYVSNVGWVIAAVVLVLLAVHVVKSRREKAAVETTDPAVPPDPAVTTDPSEH